MLESPDGKKTYPGFLYDNLRSQARFHDPSFSTIFSHSRDIESFREWRKATSRENSRAPSPLNGSRVHHAPSLDVDTAAYLPVVTHRGEVKLPSLKTPRSSGKVVSYCIYEYENLIDSSDIGFEDWIRMASDIERNYQNYDAFIILHGTDTMAYSVSPSHLHSLIYAQCNVGQCSIVSFGKSGKAGYPYGRADTAVRGPKRCSGQPARRTRPGR